MKTSMPEDQQSQGHIRLLKVVTNFSSGGTEGQVNKLSQALDRNLISLQFVCLKEYGPFIDDMKAAGIPIKEFSIGTFYQLKTYAQIWRLSRFMRRERIQVCHSYNFYSNLIAVPAAVCAGVPVIIISIRDRGVYLSQMQRRVQVQICKLADRILVNADAIRTWLLDQGVSDNKVSILRNGIDMCLYEKGTTTSDIRAELGISPAARLVVMLARLHPQKGIDEILQAAPQIKRRHPDVHIIIVGEKLEYKGGNVFKDSTYQQHLDELTVQLGINDFVFFTGYRTDVPALLRQATLSVLPSHSEGLSNSLIESMAAGLPLVATDVGGNPELVNDGVNGLLVPVKNVAALAAAINAILDDPGKAARFGEASLRLCRESFSIKNMVTATQQVYLRELNKSHSRSVTENAN